MRTYTPFSAAAAAFAVLAGLARAEIEFLLFEGQECKEGAETLTMKFHHNNTAHFDRHVYRTVMTRQIDGASCSWAASVDETTAQGRPADVTRRGPVRARAEPVLLVVNCLSYANDLGQSIALNSIKVYDC